MWLIVLASTSLGGKPSKSAVSQVLSFATEPQVVLQPPVGEPSPQLGSFLQPYEPMEGAEVDRRRVGTFDVSTSQCVDHLTFKRVPATEQRRSMVVLKSGIAASLGLPVQGIDLAIGGGRTHESLAGLEYQLTEKLVLDGGQGEMIECCVQHQGQCTDTIISEWWKGAGKLYRMDTSSAGLKVAAKMLQAAGGSIQFGSGKGFSMASEWSDDFFAYRTQRLKIPSCEDYLRSNPIAETSVSFTGVSEPQFSERDAITDARRDAQRQVVEALGVKVSLDEDQAPALINDKLSGGLTPFVCVDAQQGPRTMYQARARMVVAKGEFETARATMGQ